MYHGMFVSSIAHTLPSKHHNPEYTRRLGTASTGTIAVLAYEILRVPVVV